MKDSCIRPHRTAIGPLKSDFLTFDNVHILWYVIPNMCYG